MSAMGRALSVGALWAAIVVSAPACADPGTRDVKAGVDAWQRGDYETAFAIWRPLAITGDPDAQFNLGQAYKLGRGVPPDLLQAETWYRRAALSGHHQAEDNYGLLLFQNGRAAEAMPWLQRSVSRGEPRAQYVVGTALFNGDYLKKDWVRAYALMTRSAASGLVQAADALAQMEMHIPLVDRQRGVEMAREIELAVARGEAVSMQPTSLTPSPLQSKPVTASAVTPKGKSGTHTSTPPSTAVKSPAPVATGQRRAAAASTKSITPANTKSAAMPSGDYRIQLGAFSDKARAEALWLKLKGQIAGLSNVGPFMIKAGAVTRLQAGPFATRAAADKQCDAVRAAGHPCLSIKL